MADSRVGAEHIKDEFGISLLSQKKEVLKETILMRVYKWDPIERAPNIQS